MKKKLKYVLFFFITVFSVYFIYNVYNFNEKKVSTQIFFNIKKGESKNSIIDRLCSRLELNYLQCLLFKRKVNFDIKYGSYVFKTGYDIKKILEILKKGPILKYIKFTIIPGWTKYDIASRLSGEVKNKFLSLVDNRDYVHSILLKYNLTRYFSGVTSLEGFLYPDTYYFKKEDLGSNLFPSLLINVAVKNFNKKWYEIWRRCENDSKCNPYNLSPYQILIFASIIEKEERLEKYKPYIADILIRRYKNGWKIGADWTLCYGLEVTSNKCYKNINYYTLNDKTNSYNTRANRGLPPTPVGNPTIDSIKAVLYPIRNEYWYYLHDKDGNIHFAKTLEEHNFNKNKFLK